jgi:Dolichyl-phosphate-mannose-protein mannosyltransferase
MSEIPVGVLEEQPGASDSSRRLSLSATSLLAGLAALKLLIQFAGIRHYGFFRDELYYMACGEHLAWGYVDQPPLIALVAWFARHVLGDSLASIRLLPVLAGSAVVWITGIFAGDLGGGRFAQLLAAAAILFAPAYLAFDSFLSMNAFEPLFWLVCAWLVLRILEGGSPRLWLAFGVVAGIGLENKHSMLLFGFALATGLLLSGQFRLFRSKWIWIGALVSFAIFLPNLLWEARHGWPQIQVVRNAQLYKNFHISPLRFLVEQIIFLHPITLPIWLGGLAWYFFSREGKRFRFLGWTYLIVLGIFMLLDGKTYYPLPIYSVLMAAGGVAFERFVEPGGPWRRSLAVGLPLLLVVAGLQAVPFGVPLLPVNTFLRYWRAIPTSFHVRTERDPVVPLPQLYADMFGWRNMAQTIAVVYRSLPASERAGCAILAGNYGEAGAIDYYGPALGLPKAISGHNSYYYWGPRNYSGACMIIFGERSAQFTGYFRKVQRVATITSPHAMVIEQNLPVYLCHEPLEPLSVLWPHFKMII